MISKCKHNTFIFKTVLRTNMIAQKWNEHQRSKLKFQVIQLLQNAQNRASKTKKRSGNAWLITTACLLYFFKLAICLMKSGRLSYIIVKCHPIKHWEGISHLSLSGLLAHQHYASLSLCQSLLRCHNQPNGELQEDPEQHELELLQASHQKSDRLEWYKLWSVRRLAIPFGQSHIVCESSFEQIKKCSKVKALTYDQY